MTNLVSRKEACEKLNISERTLRRKIQELNIECVSEFLHNGVESKKIKSEDFLRIAAACGKDAIDPKTETNKSLSIISTLQLELSKIQLEAKNKDALLKEKDNLINILQEDKKFLQEQINKLTSAKKLEPKGFWKRLLGK